MEKNSSGPAEPGSEADTVSPDQYDRGRGSVSSGVADIDIVELSRVVWRDKWIICGLTAVIVAVAIAYALTATAWYRADVLLAPAKQDSAASIAGRLGGLSGLAGLAGIDTGNRNDVESLAILGSRDFIRSFIQDRALLPVLFSEQWNAEEQEWRVPEQEDQPQLKDAVKFFRENVLHLERDSQTNLVTLGIEWTAPEQAADWAMDLVRRLNEHTRRLALQEAESNIAYLRAQMEQTAFVSLRDAIGSLIETELQKAMLANGAEEYAYKVIDSAQTPVEPIKPKKVLIVLAAIVFGGLVSLFVVLLRDGIRRRLDADAARYDSQAQSLSDS